MKSFQTTWHDEEGSRLVEFSIKYTIQHSKVKIDIVTPTQVSFIGEDETVERSIGVHTAKGQEMLSNQFAAAGELEKAINDIAEKENLLTIV